MIKRVMLSMLIVVCGHSGSYAEMPVRFFAEAMLHRASIDGTVQQSDVDILGSEIDLDSTLGLEDVNGLTGKAGIIIYGRHEIVADYRRYHLSEDSTLSSSIQFGDIDFSANLPISPTLRFQTVGLFYGFRVIDMDWGFFSLRPGVEFVEYEVGVEASVFGVELLSSSYSEEYVVPFMLVAGEVKLHPMISLTGEFSGGMIDEQSGYFLQPALKVTPHPNVSLLVGYSQVWFKDDFKDDIEDNLFEITLSGIVAGIQLLW